MTQLKATVSVLTLTEHTVDFRIKSMSPGQRLHSQVSRACGGNRTEQNFQFKYNISGRSQVAYEKYPRSITDIEAPGYCH